MLKFSNLPAEEIEHSALAALISLLEFIPIIEIKHVELDANGIDFIVTVRSRERGKTYQIGCEVKSNGQPRYAQNAMLQLMHWKTAMRTAPTLVFIAPYISPAVRAMCQEQGVCYLDFAGNCRIAFGEVYIERMVAEAPPAEQRELKSIYKPKSARVLRVLLSNVSRAWKVKDLATESNVSLGHVSNVRSALRDRNWITEEGHGMVLTQPGQLLDEWRGLYQGPEGVIFNFYTTLHGTSLERAARQVMNVDKALGHLAAMSSFSAANWMSPYGRTGTTYFYADQQGVARLVSALSMTPAKGGANVQIIVPKDDAPFLYAFQPLPNVFCTSPVQTYLDLYAAGERGQESAQHLREEKLAW